MSAFTKHQYIEFWRPNEECRGTHMYSVPNATPALCLERVNNIVTDPRKAALPDSYKGAFTVGHNTRVSLRDHFWARSEEGMFIKGLFSHRNTYEFFPNCRMNILHLLCAQNKIK